MEPLRTHVTRLKTYIHYVHLDAQKARARLKGVRFTVIRVLVIFCATVLASGCTLHAHPDLSHFQIEDFQNYAAPCSKASQCRYIGFGIGNGGCSSSPIFEDFIVYSTKMGRENIRRLEQLAKKSRYPFSEATKRFGGFQLVNQTMEEVCLPVGNLTPILKCINKMCLNVAGQEL